MELSWKKKSAQIVMVTRAIGQAWLARNTLNREIRDSNMAQYTQDAKSGRWLLGPDAIAFDRNGVLVNGQHRLKMVVDTGIPCEFIVATGLDPAVRIDADTHGRRSVADGLRLSGRADCLVLNRGRNTAAGMWSRMLNGARSSKGGETRAQLGEFIDKHREAGTWALAQFTSYPQHRGVVVAPTIAAVARAYYHYQHDLDELMRFVRVFVTGEMDAPHDATVIRYRNLLTVDPLSAKRLRGNSNLQPAIYRLTCRVIQAFMSGETLTKFYDPKRELFPLPGEEIEDDIPEITGLPLGVAGDERQPGARRPRVDRVATAQAH